MRKSKPISIRMKTGTYTGDGSESHAITGVGFRPKEVTIYQHHTSEGGTEVYVKSDQMATTYCIRFRATDTNVVDDCVLSLDADGFTVDDAGSDTNPNKDTRVYDYVAFG